MTKTITEEDRKYFQASQIFVKLAKNGDLKSLIEHVYVQDDPFMKYAPRARLAKNALSYFISYNQVEAFEQYFSSPFFQDLTKEDFIIIMERITMQNSKQMFDIIQPYYLQQLNQEEKFNVLIKACTNNAIEIVKEIINQYNQENKILTQEEKMQCCLAALSNINKDDKIKSENLTTFRVLETLFTDLRYHQQDDILMRTLVQEKNTEAIHYLMYDKKLRITKPLNILAWGNQDFAKIVEKRKVYDSMNQKMKNKEKMYVNEPEKTKRLKI